MPNIACLGAAPLPGALAEHLSETPLQPMFEIRRRRQVRRIELPAALIDVAFDEGIIEAATRCEELIEIRLALHAGEVGMLYEVGMRLLELAPVRVNTASTVRRGYALASGSRPKAAKAAPSSVARGVVADEMIAAVLGGCLAHLEANQMAAEDGSGGEGVHQMRVALRRLRTALSLLHREMPCATMPDLGAEAKWLADALGPARGWDVFLSTTLAAPERLCVPGPDFGSLRMAAEVPREASYASVREAIASMRAARLQMRLAQWIARHGWRDEVDGDGIRILGEPAASLAARVLSRLHRKALKQGRHFASLSAGERHALRITLKKLRYAGDFFLPLTGEPATANRFFKRLAALQDALGLDHDAATTQPLLDQIARQRPGASAGMQQAIGAVIGWQGRDALAAGESLSNCWRRFKSLPPFWTGARSPL